MTDDKHIEVEVLTAEDLRTHCDSNVFGVETTDEISDDLEVLGQARAINALQFGISMRKPGYNIFVSGPWGVGKRSITQSLLKQSNFKQGESYDWAYVYNFKDPNKPIALKFSPGHAAVFHDEMVALVERLQSLMLSQSSDEALRELDEVVADLSDRHQDNEKLVQYLLDAKADIANHLQHFVPKEDNGKQDPLFRYQVNVVVDKTDSTDVPVIYELDPTYPRLVGQVNYVLRQGVQEHDFTLIKPGALHRANGGYLLLDMDRLLYHTHAWEGLKRVLLSGYIGISPLDEMMGFPSSVLIQPEPIPLKLKVILFGDRETYFSLCDTELDFKDLFKVVADFEDEIDRTDDNMRAFSRLISTLVQKENLKPFHKAALAKLVDYSVRLIGDAEYLSSDYRSITDLLCEADFLAEQADHKIVRAMDVEQAIDNQVERQAYFRKKFYTEIERDYLLIATEGEAVGQMNALSVIQSGHYKFGMPCRVTAMARIGDDGVVDVEREVDFGEASHSKGVLILTGYLKSHFSKEKALSLSANIVVEQSYDTIEGDSASMCELITLMSAIAGVPINQGISITASVNQHGDAQAIGYVNEKIEGYFDICEMQGLTGEQGVIIPEANVKQLMLREDIVSAVSKKLFHIYPITHVNQAIEILTVLEAGKRESSGQYAEDSFNYFVERRLEQFSGLHKKKNEEPDSETESGSESEAEESGDE